VIQELGLSATTRQDGKYAILVPGGRVQGQQVTILARAINYKPRTAQVTLVAGILTQDLSLAENPLQLGEIVVTGAGTATEVEKLGTVRSVVTAEEITRTNETNIVQALAGQAANVQVTSTSGEPGAGSYITIRGSRTVGIQGSGSAQPLFVVDGVPIDNSSLSTEDFNPTDGLTLGAVEGSASSNRASDLNPDDIESIEILKGAAAAAIYGSRAGQGVVLITTKKGKPGPTRWTLSSTAAANDLNRTYPLQQSWAQGIGGMAPDSADLGGGDCTPGRFECRTSWGPRIQAGTPVYDHANEAYRTGFHTTNTATVSGGNDRTLFYLSGSFDLDKGIFEGPNNEYRRTTVRFNGSHRLADNFKLGGNFAYTDANGRFVQRGNNTSGLQLDLLRSPPNWNNRPYIDPATGLQRTFRHPNPAAGDINGNPGWDNPFYTLNNFINTQRVGRAFGNVSADWDALSWLKFAYTLGADYANDERLDGGPGDASPPINGGRIVEGKAVTYQIDHNLTGTARYRISPKVAGTITLGQNLNERTYRSLANVGRGLIAPKPFKLSNTIARDPAIDDESTVRQSSVFSQVTLDLFNQLYLNGALRNDGSSTYDKDHRRAWFPKAGAAWEFTRATGSGSLITYGKLRAAYGEAGQEPDPYLTSNIYTGGLVGGQSQGTGVNVGPFGGLVSSIVKGADQLKPERTKEWEVGFDVGLFKDKADISFTNYRSKSVDVILLTPLPPSSGYQLQANNQASFRGFGQEVTLNIRPITKRDFSWDVGLQWARNRSRVLTLGGADFVKLDPNDIEPPAVAQVGEEVGVFRGQGLTRCGISNGSVILDGQSLASWCAGAKRGALYLDADGFPVADPDDRIIGNPNPRWTGSVRTTVRYRKLTLSGLLDIKHGGQMYNGTRAALLAYGTHKDTRVRADCYTYEFTGNVLDCTGNEHSFGKDGPINGPVVGAGVDPATGVGRPVPIGENWYTGVGGLFAGTDQQWIEDAGFVKLREISLSYRLDSPGIQRALGFIVDLRVSARNLKTWTKYTGYDPETNLGQAQSATRGKDYFNQPQARSYVFSVTLSR
jgi:TonB-linked SusC/RagA family outer membrane protein